MRRWGCVKSHPAPFPSGFKCFLSLKWMSGPAVRLLAAWRAAVPHQLNSNQSCLKHLSRGIAASIGRFASFPQ